MARTVSTWRPPIAGASALRRSRFARLAPALLAAFSIGLARPVDAASSIPASIEDKAHEVIVESLLREGGRSDPATVRELAELRSVDALEGLLQALPKLSTIELRTEVMRCLVLFDGVPGAGQRAADVLAEYSLRVGEPEVSAAALEGLAACEKHGPEALAALVESTVTYAVREPALELLLPDEGEELSADLQELLEMVYETEPAPPGVRLSKKQGIPYSQRMRFVAFESLAPGMSQRDITAATKDDYAPIRLAALEELNSRPKAKVSKLARDLYKRRGPWLTLRTTAAEILLREKGAVFARDLAGDISNPNTVGPSEREAMGELLDEFLREDGDKKLRKTLLKWLEKGEPAEQITALRGLASDKDPEVIALRRVLVDSEVGAVRHVAVEIMARDPAPEDLVLFDRLLAEKRDTYEVLSALEVLDPLRRGDAEWDGTVTVLAGSQDRLVRNAALELLVERAGDANVDLLVERLGHEDWATRMIVVQSLDKLRAKSAVPFLIEMLDEEPHLRLRDEVAETLLSLTGQTLGGNARAWRAWWDDHKDEFVPLTEEERVALGVKLEERRRRQVSTASFFGVNLHSDRILFVIDVSGSMEFPTEDGPDGEKRVRFDVVKEELKRTLTELPSDCLLDIVVFSSGVGAYKGELFPLTPENRAAALQWVEDLGAGGGTNIHDAIWKALNYEGVDTVFFLSDGEPSVGRIIDERFLRRQVVRWNRYRKAVIHAIAIASDLRLLDWIAEDSGGTSVRHF